MHRPKPHDRRNEMSIQDPWMSAISRGVITSKGRIFKTVEGRAGRKGSRDYMKGALWDFFDPSDQRNRVQVRIGEIRWYATMAKYIEGEGREKIAPQTGSNAGAAAAYAAIRSREGKQVFGESEITDRGGVNAIEFVRI